jgi:hypothetical protein
VEKIIKNSLIMALHADCHQIFQPYFASIIRAIATKLLA